MDILFYDTLRIRNLGTYSVHIYELVSNLSRLGHNIVPVKTDIPRDGEEIDAKQHPSLWERIKIGLRSSPIYEPLKGEITIFWSFLNETRIFLSAFILIVKLRGGFDVIYRRHSYLNSEYFLAKLFRIPSVKEVNGIIADEAKITKQGDNFSLWITKRIERFTIGKADKIVVVTSKLKEVLHDDYIIPEDKIVVIPNGANINLFKPMDAVKARRELNLNQSASYVCFVGNLWPPQGVQYLIRSMAYILDNCPNTWLLIVGDGMIKKELEELTKQIGVSARIIFTEAVPYQKVPLYISASDICVAPFIRERNERCGVSPLKLCEYMACGKPVVGSRVSGLEMLEQNDAGILTEPENPEALANAIIRLLQDPEIRKQMGKNGRRYVVENRSWESVAKRVAQVCEQTIKKRQEQ